MEIENRIIADPAFIPPPPPDMPPPVPTPDNPPWGFLEGFGVWLLSVVLIVVIPSIALLVYIATQKVSLTDQEQLLEFVKNDATSIFLQLIAILPAHLLTLAVAWIVVTRGRKYPFREMLGWNGGGLSMWIAYPLILIGFLVVAAGVSKIYPEQENEMLRMLQTSRAAVYAVALIATLTAPIVEEVVYRGLVYSAARKTFGAVAAFIISTSLFALVHVPQYWPSYSTIFLLLLLSITLTTIRAKTGNLLPCIILHTVFNGFQSAMLVLEPYLPKEPTAAPDPTGLIMHLIR